jgi:hypothetical protein
MFVFHVGSCSKCNQEKTLCLFSISICVALEKKVKK